MLKVFLAAALLVISGASYATPAVVSSAPVVAQRYVSELGVGMVVNWASTERGIREFDPLAVRDYAQRGFGHVIIRIGGIATSQRLLHLRKIVEACARYQVTPVIMWNGPENALSESSTISWWSELTHYFKGEYPQLGFMVLGEEARDTRTATSLNHLYGIAFKTIHDIDSRRIVLFSPHLHGAPEMLPELRWPPDSTGLVAVGWSLFGHGPQKAGGRTPWSRGTSAEKAAIRTRIHTVVRWQQKTGRATLVSAFSPLTNGGENTVAARSLANFVACELQQVHIPLTLVGDARYYDGEEGAWRPEMQSLLDAVLEPACSGHTGTTTVAPAGKSAVEPVMPHSAG